MKKGIIHPKEQIRRFNAANAQNLGGNEQRLYKLALMTDVMARLIATSGSRLII